MGKALLYTVGRLKTGVSRLCYAVSWLLYVLDFVCITSVCNRLIARVSKIYKIYVV